jgi:hypothetical protein
MYLQSRNVQLSYTFDTICRLSEGLIARSFIVLIIGTVLATPNKMYCGAGSRDVQSNPSQKGLGRKHS